MGIMTSHLILSLYYRSHVPPNEEGVGEGLRGVLWVWVIVGEECEVYCEDVWWSAKSARWPVGLGLGKRRL